MWMILALPILIIFCGGALATYGIMTALSIGVKITVYAIGFLFFFAITTGLILLIVYMYKNCETKVEKIFCVFFVTSLLVISVVAILFNLKSTNITVVNGSQNEIITEIHLIPVSDETKRKETKVFDNNALDFENLFTDEMTKRCKKFGLNYKKGQEWFYLKENEKDLVCGLWNSESYSFIVPKGTWIITLKTVNRNTRNYYTVIYNQNAFCTHLGENLSFTYSGEDISLTEHQKSQYMPEVIDKYLKKEVAKKFEPNLIVITKKAHNVISNVIIKNESQFTIFPDFNVDKYDFRCLIPDTYTAKVYFSEWNGNHYVEVFSEERELNITHDRIVLYFDEEKKTIKQLQASGNYAKLKIEE